MDNSNSVSFLPGYGDAASYVQDALRRILTATKSSNELPSSGDDFDYYSTFPGFRAIMQKKRQVILELMTSIIQNHGVRESFAGRELEEKFDLLVDVNDIILENANNYLDEAEGLKKSEEELVLAVKPANSINTSWNKKQFNTSNDQKYKLLTAKNIARPQLQFKDKIDNSNSIFMPIIKEKPNSIRPLAVMLEGDKEEFVHPYECEIEKFTPPEEDLNLVEKVVPKPLDETPLILVNTEKELKQLCSDLLKEKEIAVDLEHHSYRSFQGFTCLMQISTRSKDYIIDTLTLRSELHILNEVFTHPKIVKVLHGADMDVIWLQRDFGIYIVNLFDTGQAARVLHFAHYSLSFLLKHYCKLEVDKRYQLADWRIRPLPEEMTQYAREDTHYLLYIYDCMKNDLLQQGNEMKNLLISTIDRSKVICAKKYQKPLFAEDKYLELYKKTKKILNTKQLYCLKQLYAWRDKAAREYDESFAYVLPNHMLLQIAEALPREQQGILACCNPIPPLVKQQLNELHTIVIKATESSSRQLESLELEQKAQAPKIDNNIDLNNLIHCLHDIHHLEDHVHPSNQSGNSENLLPIIVRTPSDEISNLNVKPALTAIFEKTNTNENVSDEIITNISKLLNPFQRYDLTKKLQADEESKTQSQVKSKKKDVSNDIEIIDEFNAHSESMNSTKDSDNVETNEAGDVSDSTSPQRTLQSDIMESTPLPIRKKRNKKRKKNKIEPDISIIEHPSPSKQAKTPEVVTIDDGNFAPYDYNSADLQSFSGNRSGNRSSKKRPVRRNQYETPRPYMKRKQRDKQDMFTANSSKNEFKQNWPKK